MTPAQSPSRLAILMDYPQEGWVSMDLCAGMLLEGLRKTHADRFDTRAIVAPYRRRASWLSGRGRNVDRLVNRFWDYPRYVRRQRGQFDLFHVADHSYSQLIHELPADCTGVYCHDLDTFRCILEPSLEPRPRWFRAMARRILNGMQKAAVVFHSTRLMREQILRWGLVDADKLILAPLGVASEFTSPVNEHVAPAIVSDGRPYILHVGSAISRKRLDVLLNTFATVRQTHPSLRLIQVGGSWTVDHQQIIDRCSLRDSIIQTRGLDRRQLAYLYHHACVVLQPSEAEGFGLPVIEALACGATVVASDLPLFHEVAGEAVSYAPMGNVQAWASVLDRLLTHPDSAPSPSLRAAQAALYTWDNHCRIIADTYQRLVA